MEKEEEEKKTKAPGASGTPDGASAIPAPVPELRGTRKRLKEKYPDEDPADDDAWDALGERYMDESEKSLAGYRDTERKMEDLIGIYPEFAEVVYRMVEERMPFRAAIASVMSQEDLLPQEGDDDYEAYQKAYSERLEKKRKKDAVTREIDDNERKSLGLIHSFCRNKGLDDAGEDSLVETINRHFNDLLYKRVTEEMLEGFLKQARYDGAVADAEKAGETKGRNAAIEAKRRKESALAAGDGVPDAEGSGDAVVERRKGGVSDFLGGIGNRRKF